MLKCELYRNQKR